MLNLRKFNKNLAKNWPERENSAADYFPLNTNLILLLIGLFLGQTIHPKLKSMNSNNIFKFIGQNSLEMYTSHFIIDIKKFQLFVF